MQIMVSNTGMVTSYSSKWSISFFESTNGIIPLKTTCEIFLNYRPLVLYYVKISNQNGSTSTIKLVYEPEVKPAKTVSDFLDAMTGKPLGWDGKSLEQSARAYHFRDISATNYVTRLEAALSIVRAIELFSNSNSGGN